MLGLSYFLNWIGPSIISIAKTVSNKIRALIRFILLRFHCISINLPYTHVSYAPKSGLESLIATWDWWKSYKNEYAGLLVLYLLLLLNPCLFAEMWPA